MEPSRWDGEAFRTDLELTSAQHRWRSGPSARETHATAPSAGSLWHSGRKPDSNLPLNLRPPLVATRAASERLSGTSPPQRGAAGRLPFAPSGDRAGRARAA